MPELARGNPIYTTDSYTSQNPSLEPKSEFAIQDINMVTDLDEIHDYTNWIFKTIIVFQKT